MPSFSEKLKPKIIPDFSRYTQMGIKVSEKLHIFCIKISFSSPLRKALKIRRQKLFVSNKTDSLQWSHEEVGIVEALEVEVAPSLGIEPGQHLVKDVEIRLPLRPPHDPGLLKHRGLDGRGNDLAGSVEIQADQLSESGD